MRARNPDEPEIPNVLTASPDDKSSVPTTPTRRSGDGPYRDAREVLLAKRRRTRRRLEEAERAAQRADELRKELDYFDTSLRSASSALLAQVRITTPCRERWDEMVGDDVVRHCSRCRNDVFDLATMRTREAEALLQREGTELAQLRRRRDGRVVAGACPGSRGAVKIAGALTFAAACAALVAHVDTVRSANEASPLGAARPSAVAPPIHLTDLHDDARDAPPPLPMHSFVVDEQILMHALRNPRVIYLAAGDEITGVQVFGIGKGNALASIGLRNRDTLRSIAGLPIRSFEALGAGVAEFERQGGGVIEVERDGVPTMHYVVLRRW
ncbi:MAG: hypothetical protein H6721_14530 [Sandaracinus sp.]|nr:hypothetical protein [Sandaracinus sp.]MCB9633332.1 hypothetical protein [Sandaracinus sp.]